MASLVFVLASLLTLCVRTVTSNRQAEMQEAMYNIIRVMALPGDESEVATQRFIMMTPGKTLNYADYYPGYKYLQGQEVSAKC